MNISETSLRPIQRTMKLRAVIPLSNGSIAVDTHHVSTGSLTLTMMEPLTLRRARGGQNTH